MNNNCKITRYTKNNLKKVFDEAFVSYFSATNPKSKSKVVKKLHKNIIDGAASINMELSLERKSFNTHLSEIQKELMSEFEQDLRNNGVEDDVVIQQLESFGKDLNIVVSNLIAELKVPENEEPSVNPQPESQNTTDQDNKPIKKQKIKIRKILNNIFGSSIGPKQYRQQLFGRDVFRFICAGDTLITNQDELNAAIAIQKNKYYSQILQYLEQYYGYDISSYPDQIFNDDSSLNPGYEEVLRIFEENVLPDITKDRIRFGWASAINGETNYNSETFSALNSFINLKYFDSLLKEKIGKVIGIDKDVEENVEVNADQNKYFFKTVINDLSKGWETQENQDALETTSRFSKLIIENIPMLNYKSGKQLNYNVSSTTFAGAFCNLFSTLINCNSANKVSITDYLFYMHRNPKKYVKKVLYNLFEGQGNYGLRTELISEGLSEFDLNVLYSSYQFLFNPETGLEKIETNYMKNKDTSILPNQYPLIECVVGVIDRLMGINYLQYNVGTSGNMEISIKPKFRTKKKIFDLINKVNRSQILRQESERINLQNKYQFQRIDEKTWEFKIGDTTYRIQATSDTIFTNEKSLLKKVVTLPDGKIELQDISFIALQKDFHRISENEELKSILQFIQDLLTPIKFESDLDIDKLISAGNLNNKLLREMFRSAAKSGIINKIHVDYINSQSEDIFSKWVSDNFFELSGTLDKKIWTSSLGDLDLVVLQPNDKWMEYYVTGEAVIDGSIGQSTIKDMDGNSIGNFSTAYLGGNIFYYLKQSQEWRSEEDTEIKSVHGRLLFSRDSRLITGVVVNLDSSNQERTERKLAKAMNVGELAEQSIFHNFFESFYGEKTEGSFFIQPTTFSDKTKFVQYRINGNGMLEFKDGRKYSGSTIKHLSKDMTLQLYLDTIGEFYKQEYSNTLIKLKKVFGLDPKAKYEDVLAAFERLNENHTSPEGKKKSQQLREQALIDLAQQNNITLFLDSDYVISDGKIQFNPLLDYYANYLYANESNLDAKLTREKINFLNDIISSNDIFYIKRINGELTSIGQVIEKIFSDEDTSNKTLFGFVDSSDEQSPLLQYYDKWIDDDKLILAKKVSKDGKVLQTYVYGDKIPEGTNIVVNPLLDYYFYTESVLSGNLRLALTGAETAHPIKWDDSSEIPNPLNRKKKGYYTDKMFNRIETLTQGAQLKRNVIIPATLQYFQQNTLRGVPTALKIATIRDLKAPVFNFLGDSKAVDGSDGAGYSNSLITILENYSLQDQRVGTIKKTIAHSPNYATGGSFLGKWAIFGITAETMHGSLRGEVSLYEIDKKLLNVQWYGKNGELSNTIDKNIIGDRKIDITQIVASRNVKSVSVRNTFKSEILKGRNLYYINPENGSIKEIVGFGRTEEGIYYTEEYDIQRGKRANQYPQKIYHIFSDEDSKHVKLNEEDYKVLSEAIKTQSEEKVTHFTFELDGIQDWHTINSNYELKESLGGIYSVAYNKDEKRWDYSDSSSFATCEFLNLVAFRRDTSKTRSFDQEDFYQPLKHAMIHYAVNNTAVKNGAGNINQANAWKNKSKLSYMTVQYDGIGVQMDADHTADEALLTEFSQVISSLDALGNLHEHAKNIFSSLQKVARSASITELEALDKFIDGVRKHPDQRIQLLSDLYDIVGRSIINNFRSNNEGSLAEDVIKLVEKHFNQSLQHYQDVYKIPFSDPGIFNGIIPVFASQINQKSVKRKYAGSGYVMCAGYNSRQVFDLDGYTYQFNDIVDLVKELINNPKNTNEKLKDLYRRRKYESAIDWERRVVDRYLEFKQNQLIDKSRQIGNTKRNQFIPTDNVLVIYKDKNGNEYKKQISLSEIDNYVTFTSDYWWILLGLKGDKNNYDLENAEFFHDIKTGRDLAPSKITWKDADGIQHNIFELDEIRKGFTSSLSFNFNGEKLIVQVPKTFNSKSLKELQLFVEYTLGYKGATDISITKNIQERASVQKVFNDLSEGYFTRNGSVEKEKAFDIQNKPSEVILSSMHRSKFPNKPLPYILRNYDKVFVESINYEIAGSEKYDLTLVNPTNKHEFISFKPIFVSEGKYGNREIEYRYKKYIEEVIPPYINENGELVNQQKVILIYNIDQNTSIPQYPIGILELADETDESIYRNIDKGILQKGYIRLNNKIYKETYFVKQYSVPHKFKINDIYSEKESKKTIHQTIYYIDRNLIHKYYGNYQQVGSIISKLYESTGAKELRLNLQKVNSAERSDQLQQILSNISLSTDIEQTLIKNIIENVLKNISILYSNGAKQIDILDQLEEIEDNYFGYVQSFYKQRKRHRISSFHRSLEVIMSRIPAQSLQSFMKGQVVGFLNTEENHAYVSHWQLYLQGSDYDIDKSYIMGASFTNSGMYYSWSPLFDFFSINTLHASETYIPVSSGQKSINIVDSSENAIDITDYVNQYTSDLTIEENRINNLKLFGQVLKLIEESEHRGVNLFVSKSRVLDKTKSSQFINLIRKHLEYVPTEAVRENAIKNNIQSGIGYIVQDLKNMIHAYSPITMDELKQDPRTAKIMSLMNPMTKYVMQTENMIGKDVIGISAVGEKVFFTLTYYWNEQLRKGKTENLLFEKKFDRIQNRKEDQKLKSQINKIIENYRDLINNLPDEYDLSELTTEEQKQLSEGVNEQIIFEQVRERKETELRQKRDEEISKLRKDKGGLITRKIDELANINYGFDGVEELKNSFTTVNEVYNQVLNEGKFQEGSAEFVNEIKEKLRVIQDNSPKADLFISQLLSAATDNAKELILAQINAGSDLAGIYMYLISLGFEIKDVVAFMTSPAMIIVHKLLQSNMFDQRSQKLSTNDLVEILTGNFRRIKDSKTFQDVNEFKNYLYNLQNNSEELTGGDRFKLIIKTILNSLEGQDVNEFFADVEELRNIISGSQEHSNLGGIFLKLNQGLPTSQEDLLKKLQRIDNLVRDRVNVIINPTQFKKDLKENEEIDLTWEQVKSGSITKDQLRKTETFKELVNKIKSQNPKLNKKIIEKSLLNSIFKSYVSLKNEEIPPMFFGFNVRQWVQDNKYKQDTINFYNLIKDTWNIFDVVDKVPQYNELLNLFNLVYTCNDELVLKSRILNIIHQKLLKKRQFLDDKAYSRLMEYVDDRIIDTFLSTQLDDYKFYIPPGFGYINSGLIIPNESNVRIDFYQLEALPNFKRFFEEYFIKNLMNPDFDATNIIGKKSIADNDFIKNLVIEIDSKSGKPFYKLDINMAQIETGIEAQTLYENMLNGLEQLSHVYYQNHSIAEWFMLYNLVVNKNKYGEDRLTSIFKSFVDSDKSGSKLYNDYYNFIGTVDHTYHDNLETILGINYNDIDLYLAPVVPEYLEQYSKTKYILQYVDGMPIYKYRKSMREPYVEINTGISRNIISTKSQQETDEIRRNTALYYLRLSPNQSNIQYFRDSLDSGEMDKIITALRLLESNEIVLFDINC